MTNVNDRYDLMYGMLGNGITIFNRKQYEHGDYKTIAHIGTDRSVTFYAKRLPAEIREKILQYAKVADVYCY